MALANDGKDVNPVEQHPLLITVVLKKVFQYLEPNASWDTRKSIRQVCKVWRDESLDCWRQTAVLNLSSFIKQSDLSTLTQLLGDKPFQKYKLDHGPRSRFNEIDIPACFKQGTQANRFWSIVGPHVKDLSLDGVNFICRRNNKEQIREEHSLMHFLIKILPNLKALSIESFGLNFEGLPWMSNKNDEEFLKLQHPKLEYLKFGYFPYFTLNNFPNLKRLSCLGSEIFVAMLEAVYAQNKESGQLNPSLINLAFGNLTDFELFICTGESDYTYDTRRLVSKLNFSGLQRLSFDFRKHRHNSGFRLLPVFMKSHCEQLKTLELSCLPYARPYSNFPFECQLNQLTELRLWGKVVKDLSFLKWTPKLKILHMDPYGLEKQREPHPGDYYMSSRILKHDLVEVALKTGNMEGVVLPDLEYLQINCGFPVSSLKQLGEWMPNVKTLQTVLWTGSIVAICEQWPLLEHLVGMYGSNLTDEDIVGTESKGKGLPDLGQLKIFQLNAACDEGELTDVSVHSGFLKMNKLTELKVCVSDKFTLNAEEVLKDQILSAVVIRNYSGNKDHNEWECCKTGGFMEFLHNVYGSPEDGNSSSTSNEYVSGWESEWSSEDDDDGNEKMIGLEKEEGRMLWKVFK